MLTRVLAAALLLALLGFAGQTWRLDRFARRVAEERLQQERAAAADRETQAENGRLASRAHEAERERIARAEQEGRRAVKSALSSPIACPADHPPALADVRIPAAALDGLRRAAGDGAAAP